MGKLVQSTDYYSANNLDIHYYHDVSIEESKRQLYNDDGLTPNAFEKGEYELLKFKAEIQKKWLEIDFEAKTGSKYSTNTKQISLIVHNIDWKPKKIKINGKTVDVKWDASKNLMTIPVIWNTNKELKVKLKR